MQQIEEKFEGKKRKFIDDSEKFNDALKKVKKLVFFLLLFSLFLKCLQHVSSFSNIFSKEVIECLCFLQLCEPLNEGETTDVGELKKGKGTDISLPPEDPKPSTS